MTSVHRKRETRSGPESRTESPPRYRCRIAPKTALFRPPPQPRSAPIGGSGDPGSRRIGAQCANNQSIVLSQTSESRQKGGRAAPLRFGWTGSRRVPFVHWHCEKIGYFIDRVWTQGTLGIQDSGWGGVVANLIIIEICSGKMFSALLRTLNKEFWAT